MTKTYKTSSLMSIVAITSILILAPTMSSNAFATSHLTYADTVVDSDINHTTSGRTDPNQALGPEDYVGQNPVSFVSLGFEGSITLSFDEPVGGMLTVFEATNGNTWPLEQVNVEVSADGAEWTSVGTATNEDRDPSRPNNRTISTFDLSEIGCISQVRLTDITAFSSGNPGPDYFDVDAVGITGDVECIPPCEVVPFTINLIAGQHNDSGDVEITNDGDNLIITITTQDGWSLSESHVSVQDSEDNIPQTKKGNPIPGQFEYFQSYDPNVTESQYIIPLDDLPEDLTIAVHTVVQQIVNDEVVSEETAWAEGERFVQKGNWGMYTSYGLQCIE